MFRRDFAHLLDSKNRFERFKSRGFEPVEYIWKILREPVASRLKCSTFRIESRSSPLLSRALPAKDDWRCRADRSTPQRNRIRRGDVTGRMLRNGGQLWLKRLYVLSLAVGADLFGQVVQQDRDGGARQLIASGTSCTEQLHAGFERKILHPMELLETLIERQKESDKVAKDAEDAEVEADFEALKRSKKGSVQKLNRVYDRDVVSRARQ